MSVSLRTRLLLSYLVVIVVGATTLWFTASATAPRFFEGHLRQMGAGPGLGMGRMMAEVEVDLERSFQASLSQALLLAIGAAAAAAFVAGTLVSERIVAPLRRLQEASHRIGEGEYATTLPVTGLPELDELVADFNKMAADLADADRQRDQLIGSVAHELRTPLAGLRGYLEGLEDGVFQADRQTLQAMERQLERLSRLAGDLRAVSVAGRPELRLAPTPPAVLLERAAEPFRPAFTANGVRLEMECPSSLPQVNADTTRLGQVLSNLLENALRHTPAGGRVRLSATAEHDSLRFTVDDSGEGIMPEDLPHIFERFYRGDRSRHRAGETGSGVGLSIARELVELHGGRIWAESEPGRGTRVHFTLPTATA
jgi:histidine kinase